MRVSIFWLSFLVGLAHSKWVNPPDPADEHNENSPPSYLLEDSIFVEYNSTGWEQHKCDAKNVWIVSEQGAYSEIVEKNLTVSNRSLCESDPIFEHSRGFRWQIKIPVDVVQSNPRFLFQVKSAEEEKFDTTSFAFNSTAIVVLVEGQPNSTTSLPSPLSPSLSAPTSTGGASGLEKGSRLIAGVVAGNLLGVFMLLFA